jgi:hypothetical protein
MPSEPREPEASHKSLPWNRFLIPGGALVLLAVGIIGLVVGARFFGLIGYYSVPSGSMAPTIRDHGHLCSDRLQICHLRSKRNYVSLLATLSRDESNNERYD